MMLGRSVDIVEPGAPAKMDALPDGGVRNRQNSRPDADVPAQVTGYRIGPATQPVPGPDHQGDGKKHERRIGGGKTETADEVFVVPREVESGDRRRRDEEQSKMVPQETRLKAISTQGKTGRDGSQKSNSLGAGINGFAHSPMDRE